MLSPFSQLLVDMLDLCRVRVRQVGGAPTLPPNAADIWLALFWPAVLEGLINNVQGPLDRHLDHLVLL